MSDEETARRIAHIWCWPEGVLPATDAEIARVVAALRAARSEGELEGRRAALLEAAKVVCPKHCGDGEPEQAASGEIVVDGMRVFHTGLHCEARSILALLNQHPEGDSTGRGRGP